MLRLTLGRPRPGTNFEHRLHGPSTEHDLHSFPSAHTGTAFGAGVALLVALPPVGVPAVVVSGCVGWSRLYLEAHYPSDVWAGMWIGLLNGVVFGLAARRYRNGSTPATEPMRHGQG